eukprot:7602123-Heterocapsa_arctica.AAC.1
MIIVAISVVGVTSLLARMKLSSALCLLQSAGCASASRSSSISLLDLRPSSFGMIRAESSTVVNIFTDTPGAVPKS